MPRTKVTKGEIENRNVRKITAVEEYIEDIDHPDFLKKFQNGAYNREITTQSKVYDNAFINTVYHMAKFGLTEKQMAACLGIGESTLTAWKRKYPDFVVAMMQGKEIYDLKMTQMLFKTGEGFFYDEIENGEHVTKDGEVIPTKKVTKKFIPGNFNAQAFWLKNRQPELWQDKSQTEIKTDINVKQEFDLSLFNEEEKQLIKNIAMKRIAQNHGVNIE